MLFRPRAAFAMFAALAVLTPRVSAADDTVVIPPGATPAYAALQALARDVTFAWAKTHPLVATSLGLTDEDGDLPPPSLAAKARDLAQLHAWEHTLATIPLAGATLVERDDAKLLAAELTGRERELTVYKTDEKDYGASAQAILDAIYTQFQHLPVPGQSGATDADRALAWTHIVERLEKRPSISLRARAW